MRNRRIEFGAYASIQWLLELLEIKFYLKGKQPKYKENDDPNVWLRDLCPDLKTSPLNIAKIDKEFEIDLEKEYGILSAHGSHPSKNFDIPRIDPDRIDKILTLNRKRFDKAYLQLQKTSDNFGIEKATVIRRQTTPREFQRLTSVQAAPPALVSPQRVPSPAALATTPQETCRP